VAEFGLLSKLPTSRCRLQLWITVGWLLLSKLDQLSDAGLGEGAFLQHCID
jgi:hypothetical protein